jgi:hypothetical protein
MTSPAGTLVSQTSWGAPSSRARNLACPPAGLRGDLESPPHRLAVASGEDAAWLRCRAAGSAAPELTAAGLLLLLTVVLGGLTLWAVAPV